LEIFGPIEVAEATAPGRSSVLASPSPSRGAVGIEFSLGVAGKGPPRGLDAQGRVVASLLDAPLSARLHRTTRTPAEANAAVPPGVYLVRLDPDGNGVSSTDKVILIR